VEALQGLGGIVFGYGLTKFLSDPASKIKHQIPLFRFWVIEFIPNLKIKLRKSVLHIHHWIFLSVALVALLWATTSFTQLLFFKSLCLGGIVQGFTFKDRFKIFY